MKRLIKATSLMMAILLGSSALNAQNQQNDKTDKYTVKTNKFWNNWFFSAGGGVNMYFGDNDSKASFGKRLSPALDVAVGKWFTPGLGLRLQYSGLSAKGATYGDGTYSTDKLLKDGCYEQKWNMMNLHADAMFDLSNMLCGYNEKRVYSFIPFVGLSWLHSYDSPRTNEIGATVGLNNRFRLCSALDLNLEAKGTLVNDRFNGEIGGNGKEGLLAVTLGVTYKFPQRTFGRQAVVNTGISEAEMQAIREKLNAQMATNKQLQDDLAAARNMKPEVKTEIEKTSVVAPYMITFPIGKSNVTKDQRVNLEFLAKQLKANPGKTYTIIGYADNKTGSAETNARLSQARAESISKVLQDFGVPTSQLKINAKGGVDNMFYNDPALSRAVIIE